VEAGIYYDNFKNMKEILTNEQNELREISPKKEIIEAIESRNSEQLFLVLEKINDELIGLKSSHFLSNSEELRGNIKSFFEDIKSGKDGFLIVYLGDDFSRLNLDFDSYDKVLNIYLTNELKDVKEKWNKLNEEPE